VRDLPLPSLIARSALSRLVHRILVGRVFHRYFRIVPADTQGLREEVFRIRYDVYCQELKWEDPRAFPAGMERDGYDAQSLHTLLLHRQSGEYVGCVRLVRVDPARTNAPLPFEKACEGRLYKHVLERATIDRLRIGEISRLAVRARFRRRAGEQNVAEGVVPERGESAGARKSPPIAMGLYLAAAASGLMTGLDGVFALMEPRLAKRLKSHGITFEQVGEPIEHRGLRAPFYITREELYANIPPLARGLLDVVLHDLRSARGWGPLTSASQRET